MKPSPAYLRSRRAKWREIVGYAGRREWTTTEQRIALDMRARGKSAFQIAMRLKGRTPDAVYSRLRYVAAKADPANTATAPLS